MRIVVPLETKKNLDGVSTERIAVDPDIFWLSENQSYLLFRDPRRRFLALKEVMFKIIAAKCRNMEEKPEKTYSKGFRFVRKNLYTLLEMLAN